MPATVEIYVDYVCPYCFLIEDSVKALQRDHDVDVAIRPYELRPDPVPTLRPEDEHRPRVWDSSVYPMARELGVDITLPTIAPQPRTELAFILCRSQRMSRAVAHSTRHVESGGIPFVALVVSDDGYTSDFGVNLVLETCDSTAHAEIVAMRSTLHARNLTDLQGMRLLATGEPCGLCYRFAFEHHIDSVHFAVDAATAARYGFDYRTSYGRLGIDRARMPIAVECLPVDRALEPFTRYLQLHFPPDPEFQPGRPKGQP
ncbi:DsbA family protein [Nocardia sp. CNY236]|uniref:DsbA family protein n=1 Tax=Nocardia sp. CNY236 TaxID=1169152 RepID=UPI00040AE7F8|nr:DsbA family protein [Nocardia sp. CNY236]